MANNFNAMIQVLVDFALGQDNECSWYGPINLLLSQGLNGMDSKKMTVVVPQLALAAISDADYDDAEDSPILLPSNMQTSPDPLDVFLIPTTPTHTPSQRNVPHRAIVPFQLSHRNIAPSSSQHGSPSQLPDSPDTLLLSYSPDSVHSHQAAKHTLEKFQEFVTRRIPDFVRLRFYNHKSNIKHRVDLLIEVKKPPSSEKLRDFSRFQAEMQVNEQAYHAFNPDPRLLRLGCLIIMGMEWMYKELRREEVDAPEDNRDSTYQPSEASSRSSGTRNSAFQTPPRQTRRYGSTPLAPPAPEPDAMTVLVDGAYLSFTEPSLLVKQKKMLRLIRERLDEIDKEMVGSYTQM